jgi:hypothetical protein
MSYVEYLRIRTPITIMLAAWIIGVNVMVVAINRFAGSGRVELWQIADSYRLASIIALGWATALGASLWLERDGHLALAWTKPDSRLRYALKVFAVDLFAMTAIFVIAALLAQLTASWSGVFHPTPIDDVAVLTAVRLLLVAFAWYGVMQALTAGLRTGSGVILGPAWAVAVPLVVAGAMPLSNLWHDILAAVNAVNPLAYGASIWFSSSGGQVEYGMRLPEAAASPIYAIVALAVIVIAALATAVSRWSLVEA